ELKVVSRVNVSIDFRRAQTSRNRAARLSGCARQPGQSRLRVMTEPEKLIPLHGGYRKLKSFLVAQLAYDVTVRFCDRYIGKRDRTHDQMVQAARSGVQNIAEGSQASGASKKTELKLTNVARASLEKAFVAEGGFTERLYKVRSERRRRG